MGGGEVEEGWEDAGKKKAKARKTKDTECIFRGWAQTASLVSEPGAA